MGRQDAPDGMRRKLSKAAVRNAKPDGAQQVFLWDTEQVGFGLRVTKAGTKSYVFSYSLPGWRSPRRITIGRVDAMTLDQARTRARRLREKVVTGVDPAKQEEEQRALPSVADLAERFLEEHVERKLKPTTARSYRQILGALPGAFRRMRMVGVTGDDVAQLHASLHKRPYQANRTLAVLRKMFGLAERWNLRPPRSNPAWGHDPYPERTDRGRRLSDNELRRVGAALREAEDSGSFDPFTIAMVRLNIFTGWRPIEVRSLRWLDVDLERRIVTLREAKTGTRTGFLGQPAAKILENLARVEDNPYCFPGRRPGQHLSEPRRLWETLREQAELDPELRFYDLVRHTFSTVAQEAGVAPEMVQVLLGHVNSSISARYTHYALERTLEGADCAAEAVGLLLKGERPGR